MRYRTTPASRRRVAAIRRAAIRRALSAADAVDLAGLLIVGVGVFGFILSILPRF